MMPLAAGPTTNPQWRGGLWVFLVLLIEGSGGIGCGRTRMGGRPVGRDGGGPSQVAKPDASFGGHPTDAGAATGGNAGASPNAGSGGSVGVGGHGAGGAGGGATRTDGAVTGGTGVGGRAAGGAGGGATRADGAVTGGTGVGGRAAGGVGGGALRAGGAVTGGAGVGGAGGAAGGVGGAGAGGRGAGGASAKPLWRDSYDKFCPVNDAESTFVDVWGDDRGVFVLASDRNSHPAIWSNLGTGWQMTFNWPGETNDLYQGGLKGFTDGPLVAFGAFPCGIQFVDSGGAECSGAASFVVDLSVVNASLVYAVNYDRVLQFDGNFWTQLGDPLPGVGWANAVWADSSTVVVAASGNVSGGLVFKIESGGAPVLLPGLSPQTDPIAVWSFGTSDIWVGGERGQLVHYDGVEWSEMTAIPYSGSGSQRVPGFDSIWKIKLWGSKGSLFAIAGNVFGQWDGTRFKILDSLDGNAYFAGLWGNSSSEVFVAVVDRQNPADSCGPFRVRWFNGSGVGPL